MTIPHLDRPGWICSADIDRILEGRKRRRLDGDLACIECGSDAVVIEAGATARVLEHPLRVHKGMVVTFHGVDRDATPVEVQAIVGPVLGRAFSWLHKRYFSLDLLWTIEQSASGVVNTHAVTDGTSTPTDATERAAFTEANDLGLAPVVQSEPVRYPRQIAPYIFKVPLYSVATSDSRDAVAALRYGLALNGGDFNRHTAGFFGDPDEPWTDEQIRGRGQRRAAAVVRWARSYEKYPEKLPPLLMTALKDPPWRRLDVVPDIVDEFVLDDESARFILDGLQL